MMGERRDKRLEADLIYIEQCERRLSENREAFFGTLGDLFELATLIPVCEQYYGAEHFRVTRRSSNCSRLFGTALLFSIRNTNLRCFSRRSSGCFPADFGKKRPRPCRGRFWTEFSLGRSLFSDQPAAGPFNGKDQGRRQQGYDPCEIPAEVERDSPFPSTR